LTATGALGLADFVSRFQNELSKDPIKLAFNTEAATADIKQKLDAAFQGFKLQAPIDVGALEKVLGKNFANPDQISAGIEEAIRKAAELRAAIDDATASNPAIANLQSELDKVFAGIENREGVRNSFGGDFSEGLRQQFAGLTQQLATLRSDSDLTAAELQKLIDARNEFGKAALQGDNPLVGRLGFAGDIQALDAAITKLQEIKALQQTTDVSGLESQLQALESVIGGIDPAPRFDAAATAIGRGVPPAQEIAAALASAADSAERAAAATSRLAVPVGRFHGGEIAHFANGGRGMDTIPAMLSPGEFVVNAASTQRFFSQLQAINAGRAPVFRQDGGVTNTTIGDIHVHESSRPHGTAREVMTAIRRQLRRGSGTL
jgi:hypothetical protein